MADITAKITIKKGLTAKVTVDRAYHAAGTTDHADLSNLAYADSGHTGFAPALGVDDNYMTDDEKTKLTGIATGATANSADATLLDRANHTGTQAESTITAKAEYAGIICSGLTEDLAPDIFAGYLEMPFAGTLIGVKSGLKDAPTLSSLIADLDLNGVSVTGSETTILAGAVSSGVVTLATPVAFDEGDIFSVDRSQVGSGDTGKGHIYYLIITR